MALASEPKVGKDIRTLLTKMIYLHKILPLIASPFALFIFLIASDLTEKKTVQTARKSKYNVPKVIKQVPPFAEDHRSFCIVGGQTAGCAHGEMR